MTYFYFSVIPWNEMRPRALDGIRRYRDIGRPFETHNYLTNTWVDIPVPLSPITWFRYYEELDSLLRACDLGTDIFILGTVVVPFSLNIIHSDHRRFAVYQMFYHNTHPRVADFLGRIRFRLMFASSTALENRMEIDRLRVATEYSNPLYDTYWCEQ